MFNFATSKSLEVAINCASTIKCTLHTATIEMHLFKLIQTKLVTSIYNDLFEGMRFSKNYEQYN